LLVCPFCPFDKSEKKREKGGFLESVWSPKGEGKSRPTLCAFVIKRKRRTYIERGGGGEKYTNCLIGWKTKEKEN